MRPVRASNTRRARREVSHAPEIEFVGGKVSRRSFLTIWAITSGASMPLAVEAVASIALAHPEWDMDELRTWDSWASDGEVMP